MEDINLTLYISVIAIIAIWVIFSYKKSQRNYRGRRNRSFRDGYKEKRKQKDAENTNTK
jgi:hypothetical protein